MFRIKFEYRDDYSKGKWNQQECVCSSVAECKKFYGLGIDCEYRIISIEKIQAALILFKAHSLQ